MEKQKTRNRAKGYIKLAPAIASACALLFCAAPTYAQGVTVEELLKLLRDKNILTEAEFKTFTERQQAVKPVAAEEPASATKAAATTPPKDEIRTMYRDGLAFENADKSVSFRVNGRVQADYRSFGSPDAANANTFDIRRTSISARAAFYNDYEAFIEADFASLAGPTSSVCINGGCTNTVSIPSGTSSHLNNAYLNVAWWQAAQIRVGQFKLPFSLEEQTGDLFIDFQERSLANSLIAGRARGVMLHGAPVKGFQYGLAYSNGAGKNTNDTNNVVDDKTFSGRAAYNFAQMLEQKNAVYHLGAAFSNGIVPVQSASNGRTEARGISFFTPSAFTGANIDRKRYGLEGALAYGPFKLQSEYILNRFEGTSTSSVNFDRKIHGYYADINWLITGEHYADAYNSGVFGRIKPKVNFAPGRGPGAWEAGLRYSKFDASDFRADNPVGTGVLPAASANQAHAWTVGLKWLPNPNSRVMLNYVMTNFKTPVTVLPAVTTSNEHALTLRAQFDF